MKHALGLISCAMGVLVGASAYAGGASPVSAGNWVVTSEVNGEPGRGMGIELRDDVLVMTVYNYTNAGDATFHLTAASPATPASSVVFKGQLQGYRGGRFLGSGARDAVETGSVGEVHVEFTSSTSGVIQFPGEQPVTMSRYEFDGRGPGQFMVRDAVEFWAMVETDRNGHVVSTQILPLQQKGEDSSVLESGSAQCRVGAVSTIAVCQVPWKGSTATLELQRHVRELEGSIVKSASPGVKNRLTGTRALTLRPGGTVSDMSGSGAGIAAFVPEPGMWIVSNEDTGRPGRGMSLDMQSDTLVMQLYGYRADGAPTFHIGSGARNGGDFSIPMIKVQGGRYYGSGALTGTQTGSDGDALIRFSSPTTGQIRLPGEQWVEMKKFHVGEASGGRGQILGEWALFGAPGDVPSISLDRVNGDTVTTSSGDLVCRFEATAQGTVRCTESFTISGRGTVYSRDWRFTPPYSGVTMVYAMKISAEGRVLESEQPESFAALHMD